MTMCSVTDSSQLLYCWPMQQQPNFYRSKQTRFIRLMDVFEQKDNLFKTRKWRWQPLSLQWNTGLTRYAVVKIIFSFNLFAYVFLVLHLQMSSIYDLWGEKPHYELESLIYDSLFPYECMYTRKHVGNRASKHINRVWSILLFNQLCCAVYY